LRGGQTIVEALQTYQQISICISKQKKKEEVKLLLNI